ncbi:hypothetical protein [Nocardia sp. NPDC020380]
MSSVQRYGIAVHFEVLMPLQDPDQQLVIYRPADDARRSALDRLRL